MDNPPILRLPDETLLDIIKLSRPGPKYHYHHLGYHTHLLSALLTCRRFFTIAQEVLLREPLVHLCNVPDLVRLYVKYPRIATTVKTLEIHTVTRNVPENEYTSFHTIDTAFRWNERDKQLKEACQGIISKAHLSQATKEDWQEALDEGSLNAFTALILVILPNLKQLLLGKAHLIYLPILSAIVDFPGQFIMNLEETPQYSSEILRLKGPSIEILELPLEWPSFENMAMHRNHISWTIRTIPYIKTMKPFRNLRTLIMSDEAWKVQYSRHVTGHHSYVFVFGRDSRLEHLIVTSRRSIGHSLEPLAQFAKEKDRLPALKKISHYLSVATTGRDKLLQWNINGSVVTYHTLQKAYARIGVTLHEYTCPLFGNLSLRPWLYTGMEVAEIYANATTHSKEMLRISAEAQLQLLGKLDEREVIVYNSSDAGSDIRPAFYPPNVYFPNGIWHWIRVRDGALSQ